MRVDQDESNDEFYPVLPLGNSRLPTAGDAHSLPNALSA